MTDAEPVSTGPDLPAVEHALWSAFVSRAILPGQPVMVDVLARHHRVSTDVLTRVLDRMVGKGLVAYTQWTGYVARELLTKRELAEIFVVRNQLEPWLAAEAATAQLQDDAYLRKLAGIPPAPTLTVLAERDAAFHRYIGALSGLDFASGAVESLNGAFHVYRRLDGHTFAPVSDSEHVAIAEAVIAGDAKGAHVAMQQHLSASSARLLTVG